MFVYIFGYFTIFLNTIIERYNSRFFIINLHMLIQAAPLQISISMFYNECLNFSALILKYALVYSEIISLVESYIVVKIIDLMEILEKTAIFLV